jgi:enoyl-CoA hydratase
MSDDTPVRIERHGAVTTVILSRPEARNAVDGPTAHALAEAFRAFEHDDGAAVAVLWGAGGHFCAGADLKAVGTPRGNRVTDYGGGGGSLGADSDLATDTASDGPMGPTRLRLTKPVIAAVSGYAVAGGLELALWCDLRVVEESAIFEVFCRRWGVPLIDGGTVRLPRLTGTSRAMDLILTGRPVTAREAERMGLANRVVPDGESRHAAEQLAAELAEFPQTCLRHDRLSVLEQEGLTEA